MARRKPRRSRRSRRSRQPLMRAWMIGLYLALSWLAISWGRVAVLPRLVQVALAEERLFEIETPCRALVIRHETILEAPAPGRFVPAVAEGQLVRAATIIGRVINEAEQRRLAGELDRVESQLQTARAELETTANSAQAALTALQLEVDACVRAWSIAAASRRFGEIPALTARLDELAAVMEAWRRRVETAREVIHRLEVERLGLIQAQEQVVVPIAAPSPGYVCLWLDGLESKLSKEWLRFQHPEALWRLVPDTSSVAGQLVRGGMPVAKLVDPFQFILAIPLSTDKISAVGEGRKVAVRIGDKEVDARSLGPVGAVRSGQQVVALSVDRVVPELLSERFLSVRLIERREYGVVIPRGAIVRRNGAQGVYTVTKTTVRFMPITQLAEADGLVLVEGLPAGTRIVMNPRIVWEGMSLP